MNLEDEAVRVAKDLGEVVFVGALAVVAHVGSHRQTSDLDLAVATPIKETELAAKGYMTRQEGRSRIMRTPNGVKLDIYSRDVSGISIGAIFKTAVEVRLRKGKVKVMGVEALLLAKLRASRPQDVEDVRQIVSRFGREIRWEVVDSLASNEVELANLKRIVRAVAGG